MAGVNLAHAQIATRISDPVSIYELCHFRTADNTVRTSYPRRRKTERRRAPGRLATSCL